MLLVIIVEDYDRSPDVIFVLIDGRQGVRLVRASLTEVDPLLNSLVFLPSVVTC
jgi:hypothetical protein